MEKFIITINRQFGSMGRPIAKEMAEALNVEFYDRDLIEAAAKKMNMSLSIASDLEESAKPNRFWRMCFPLGHDETRKQDELFQVEKKIILNLADAKSCIIVGRCSDSILKCSKHLLRIFIYAPYKERLKNCVERLKMDERTAKEMMRNVDGPATPTRFVMPVICQATSTIRTCSSTAAFSASKRRPSI